MYKQSINHIKVVIIPLDGTIFDLNRYRYNYYHHLCDSKHIPLPKEEFYTHLSNMYDMYKGLPFSDKVDIGPLNAKIEREMFQYLKMKGIKPRDGFYELLGYLHQKNIKVAVISTHRTKDAVQYLQIAKLYNKVHFIIGSDTTSMPLPSTQMLETVTNHFQVSNENTLVISSFMSLNRAANRLHMNVIYCEDLVKASLEEKETSYKTVQNLFEVLNTLLFERYEEAEMYSPILGMSSDMSIEELDYVKDKLESTYQHDPQILDVVNRTYAYHVSQLTKQNVKDGSVLIHKTPHKKTFEFDDEPLETVSHQDIVEQEISKEQIINSQTSMSTSLPEPTEDDELAELLRQINRKKIKEQNHETLITPKEQHQISEVIENVPQDIKTADEDIDESESVILNFIINILYIFAISFLTLFIGIIIYIAFINQFEVGNGVFGIITSLFNVYYTFIETIFKFVLNGLHTLISFFPSYTDYQTANPFFSVDGIKFLNIFLFQTLFISLIKGIIYLVRRNQDEIDFEQNQDK